MDRETILDEIEKIIDEKTEVYIKIAKTNNNTEKELLREQIYLYNIELDIRYNRLRINTKKK